MARETTLSPRWLDRKRAADYVGVGEDTITRWVEAGALTRHKIRASRKVWYDREEIDALMVAGAEQPAEESA